MPEWMHNRAEHILAKNPSMPKSMAFAVATQQSHALGKSPKSYGTTEGKRIAKRKFDTPKDDVKAANPGHLESPKMASIDTEYLKTIYKPDVDFSDPKRQQEFSEASAWIKRHPEARTPKTAGLSIQALFKLAMTLMEAKAAPHQALTDYMQGSKDARGQEGEHLHANPEKNQLRALHAERMQATLPAEQRVGGTNAWVGPERRGVHPTLPVQDITHGPGAAPGTVGNPPAAPVQRQAPYVPVPTNVAGYSPIHPSVLARPGVASYGSVVPATATKPAVSMVTPVAKTVAAIHPPTAAGAKPLNTLIERLGKMPGIHKAASFMVERVTMLKKADAPENNEADTLIGTNHINQAPSETNGMDGGPTGYMWSQDIPPDAPSTSGRTPGLETLHSGAEKIVHDETIGMLRRAFTNYQEAAKTDREQMSELLVNGKPGTYVTRSKTLLTSVRDLTGRT
jgi:hypothetical protein